MEAECSPPEGSCCDDDACDGGEFRHNWHFEMLHHKHRNEGYQRAIERAIGRAYDSKREKTLMAPDGEPSQCIGQEHGGVVRVIDIGAGSGLLSCMAADAARKLHSRNGSIPKVCVTACEMDQSLAQVASEVVGMHERRRTAEGEPHVEVNVLPCSSLDLPVYLSCEKTRGVTTAGDRQTAMGYDGKDLEDDAVSLGDRFDVLLAELVDATLLGECILSTFRHAIDNMMIENEIDRVIVPRSATVYGQLISAERLRMQTVKAKKRGCGISMPDVATDVTEQVQLESLPHVALSDTFSAHAFDFTDPILECLWERDEEGPEVAEGRGVVEDELCARAPIVQVQCTRSGRLDAVAFWWSMQLDEAETLSSAPGQGGHWSQAVYFVGDRLEREVTEGEVISIALEHTADCLHFTILDGEEDHSDDDGDGENGDDGDSDDAGDAGMDGQGGGMAKSEVEQTEEKEAEDETDPTAEEFASSGDDELYFADRRRLWMLQDESRLEALERLTAGVVRSDYTSSSNSTGSTGVGIILGSCSGWLVSCTQRQISSPSFVIVCIEWDEEELAPVRQHFLDMHDEVEGPRVVFCHLHSGSKSLVATVTDAVKCVQSENSLESQCLNVSWVISEVYFVPLADTWAKGHVMMWWHSVAQLTSVLSPTTVVSPSSGRLCGQLVTCPDLWDSTRPIESVCGINVSTMNRLRRPDTIVGAYSSLQHPWRAISEQFTVCDLAFAEVPSNAWEGQSIVRLLPGAAKGVVCNALVLWVDLGDGVSGSSSGDLVEKECSVVSTGCDNAYWNQGVMFLEDVFPVIDVECPLKVTLFLDAETSCGSCSVVPCN